MLVLAYGSWLARMRSGLLKLLDTRRLVRLQQMIIARVRTRVQLSHVVALIKYQVAVMANSPSSKLCNLL